MCVKKCSSCIEKMFSVCYKQCHRACKKMFNLHLINVQCVSENYWTCMQKLFNVYLKKTICTWKWRKEKKTNRKTKNRHINHTKKQKKKNLAESSKTDPNGPICSSFPKAITQAKHMLWTGRERQKRDKLWSRCKQDIASQWSWGDLDV